jgi:hypothetical protein
LEQLTKNDIKSANVASYKTDIKISQYNVSQLLFQDELKVRIGDYEKFSGGMFRSDYVMYEVQTEPFNWLVKRRYSDFAWLREVLIQEYSLSIVPPVAEKTFGKNFEDKFLLKRKSFLSSFMEYVLGHPELRSCTALKAFLSVTDSKLFESHKTDILKYKTQQTSFRDNYNSKGRKLMEGSQGVELKHFKS